MDAESSLDLLNRAKAGDDQALERLLARHLPALRRWASGRLPLWARDAIDTEDLVQETVFHTLKHLPRFEPEHDGALQAYLRQAVMNGIRNELRRASRHPQRVAIEHELPARSMSPLDQAIGGETVERYEAALARLSANDREAVIGRLELGYSFQELASALGKPSPDAARVAVNRALVRLASLMSQANTVPPR
jgi:RNA polymerase sigma factor (sigma-70 family)